jgi:hypothetical protein
MMKVDDWHLGFYVIKKCDVFLLDNEDIVPPRALVLNPCVRVQTYILRYECFNSKDNQENMYDLFSFAHYSQLSNKYVAKFFIDEIVNRILNNLHNLVEGFEGNMETADNLKKWIIELMINLQVFCNNKNVFSDEDLKLLKDFREVFLSLIKYTVELYEFNLVFDRFLLIRKCKKMSGAYGYDHWKASNTRKS